MPELSGPARPVLGSDGTDATEAAEAVGSRWMPPVSRSRHQPT